MSIDILVVGAYSREHAIAWKLKQLSRVGKIYIAPGNGGTHAVGEPISIGVMEFDKLVAFAEEKKVGLTVAGSDDPIVGGIGDAFRAHGLRIWSPSKVAAKLEGSKAFAKELMRQANIPTAEFRVFTAHVDALRYVHEKGAPIVVKASGLALGKGVMVCRTVAEAENFLNEVMVKKIFKDSGNEVVIEEFLEGPEISIHALSDGKDFIMFPTSQDHKTIGENDTGKNTGGMGAIAPVPWVTDEQLLDIRKHIVAPAIATMAKRDTPFQGLLYPGLMMTKQGPKVIEFNSRFGCPEAEVYMRLLKTDLLDLLEASVDGTISKKNIEWQPGFAVTVIMASGGYPDAYKRDLPIAGIEEAEKIEGVVVFHAGTRYENGQTLTSGGRVLSVSAVGGTLKEALNAAYQACERIQFEGKYFRRDIGAKALRTG
ncbi:MAG: phosphoribosylamine--glycine ligase [Parcubacteria group bacterium Gr01-1014_8]|nr:MAG: phosphoribosylamine--glycine ligase [Parcubacteria group bacterium Gr01-1014_8]